MREMNRRDIVRGTSGTSINEGKCVNEYGNEVYEPRDTELRKTGGLERTRVLWLEHLGWSGIEVEGSKAQVE